MLDVHAPGHPISGIRDFFIHLLTITAGLLIALGLEASVEAAHHRHQRHEAEANIRQELTANRTLLRTKAPVVIAERDDLLKLIDVLEPIAAGKGDLPALQAMKVGFNEQPIPDAAWRTAASTGALAYMDYDQVARFSDAYKQQDLLQSTEERALDDYLQFSPILHKHAADLSPTSAADLLPLVRRALAHVTGMLAVGTGTDSAYATALK